MSKVKYHSSIAILIIVITLGGCSAIITNKTDSDTGISYWGHEYSGSVCALETTKLSTHPLFWPILPFTLVDIVLSFTLETLLLPIESFADNPEHGYKRDCDHFHI
jgi:uncharacterized protein YceK